MKISPTLIVSLGVMALSSAARAQSAIDSWTIDCGGGDAAGGSFMLTGTIGQPDAGVMSGGAFTLTGGFWSTGGAEVPPTLCPADFNTDGFVDSNDIAAFLNQWFRDQSEGTRAADFNDDEETNSNDVAAFLNRWFLDAASAGC